MNHIGPQLSYPVPEGILNYNGSNYLALTVWSMEADTFQLAGLELKADAVIQSGYRKPGLVHGSKYTQRAHAY